jgi:hypothetical protein
MIIAAHMPIANISLTPNSTVDAQMLLDKLQTYPNLILGVAGHRQCNTLLPFRSLPHIQLQAGPAPFGCL